MTDEALPQNQYIYQIAQHMRETSERIEKKLDDNTTKTELVLIQATKTNGRVTGLEQFSEDTKKAVSALIESNTAEKEKHKSLILFVKALGWTALFVVPTLVTLGYAVIQKNIEAENVNQQKQLESDTASKVVSTLQEEYNLKVSP